MSEQAQKPLAIRVSDVSKMYYLGGTKHNSLRDAIMGFLRDPLKDRRTEMWALKGVSFDVREGERVGIIGRNGAGKSTILKVLSRITRPTSGTAEIHGRVASLLEVGTGFHGELSGRENVYLNGAILGMTRAEIDKKFDEIVAFSEFDQFLDTPVKHYSTGMYMRLAFSVAAHLEPEVFIVDEVLAVGDSAFQAKCVNKMREIGSSGKTIFFVSHDMDAIRRLCTRVIWLDRGEIQHDGSTDEVVDAYLASVDRFTQEAASRMTINDRLKAAGLTQDYRAAVKAADVTTLSEILKQVYMSESEADAIIRFELGIQENGSSTKT